MKSRPLAGSVGAHTRYANSESRREYGPRTQIHTRCSHPLVGKLQSVWAADTCCGSASGASDSGRQLMSHERDSPIWLRSSCPGSVNRISTLCTEPTHQRVGRKCTMWRAREQLSGVGVRCVRRKNRLPARRRVGASVRFLHSSSDRCLDSARRRRGRRSTLVIPMNVWCRSALRTHGYTAAHNRIKVAHPEISEAFTLYTAEAVPSVNTSQ